MVGTWGNSHLDTAYFFHYDAATADPEKMALNLLIYGGQIGNYLFFISSAWFLLESSRVDPKKICRMMVTIWSISLGIFLVTLPFIWRRLSWLTLQQTFFPLTFSANWYLTCYLLFYAVHPLLNQIVYAANQKKLLKIVLVMDSLYLVANYKNTINLFFASRLIIWIALYFTVAYVKLYLKEASSNLKLNLAGIVFGMFGQLAAFLLINALGLRYACFASNVTFWGVGANPFYAVATICAFNLARQTTFRSRLINRLSGLSMLTYLIHENVIVKEYFRPALYNRVLPHLTHPSVLMVTWAFAIVIFVASIMASLMYQAVLQKAVNNVGDRMCQQLQKIYSKIETRILAWH